MNSILSLFDDPLKKLLSLVKPKGKVIFNINNDENFTTRLLFLGYMNMKYDEVNKWLMSEKPNYEVGSSAKLSFGKKQTTDVKKVWKIDMDDDEDEEMINADDLLDEEDKQKPNPESLRVCATTGKRKACKDCSCGLAEELEAESKNKKIANTVQKSSCGSVSRLIFVINLI